MKQFIFWLQGHKLFNVVVLSLYYLAVVLPHKWFGTFLNNVVFVGITRDQYNLYVLIAGTVVLLFYILYFFQNTRSRPLRNLLWTYLILNIFISVLIINILFVINIEIIHFPQYAIFAILLFPLINNYNATLFWATLAGAVDEAHQYFVLSPNDTFYYDFNDVVTNLAGVVFGLLILRSAGVSQLKSFKSLRPRIFITLAGMAILFFSLYALNVLSIYPSDEHTYQLLSEDISGFWYSPNKRVTFHVMKPLEGLIITTVLMTLYQKIGSN